MRRAWLRAQCTVVDPTQRGQWVLQNYAYFYGLLRRGTNVEIDHFLTVWSLEPAIRQDILEAAIAAGDVQCDRLRHCLKRGDFCASLALVQTAVETLRRPLIEEVMSHTNWTFPLESLFYLVARADAARAEDDDANRSLAEGLFSALVARVRAGDLMPHLDQLVQALLEHAGKRQTRFDMVNSLVARSEQWRPRYFTTVSLVVAGQVDALRRLCRQGQIERRHLEHLALLVLLMDSSESPGRASGADAVASKREILQIFFFDGKLRWTLAMQRFCTNRGINVRQHLPPSVLAEPPKKTGTKSNPFSLRQTVTRTQHILATEKKGLQRRLPPLPVPSQPKTWPTTHTRTISSLTAWRVVEPPVVTVMEQLMRLPRAWTEDDISFALWADC